MDPPDLDETKMRVARRVRILSPAGAAEYGQVELPTSPAVRLTQFEGATTTADGRVVPVPADALFHSQKNGLRDRVTAVFPQVEVGATLDYSYEIRYASRFDIDPWFFQEGIPVLESELRYHVPISMDAGVWRRTSSELGAGQEVRAEKPQGTLIFRMEDLPAVTDVPFAPPFEDRANQVIVYPVRVADGPTWRPLLDRWESTALWYGSAYDRVKPVPDRLRRELLHHVLSGTEDDPMRRARALYRFVRDEITTSATRGIWPQPNSSLERVLAAQSGSPAEKALLLESLLRDAGLTARRVWAGDTTVREVDPELPYPMQFGKLLVSVESEGRRLLLDPSDRRLPFGCLLPSNEGVWAVPVDARLATPFRIPASDAESNRRDVLLDLHVDATGSVRGTGEMVLAGHHALLGRSLDEALDRRLFAWKDWLEKAFGGFRIEDFHLEESSVEQRLALRWRVTQRLQSAVDRVDVTVNRLPLPAIGPAQVDLERTLPVLLPFAGHDQVEVRVTLEPDWKLDRLPAEVALDTAVGSLRAQVSVSPLERQLIYRRSFTIHEREVGLDVLDDFRELLAAKEKDDSESLIVVVRDPRSSSRLE